jgi:D-alanyl-D-alanine dipeptidase
LKIFDAYRPYSVTVKFWELVKDERYVANPSKGSGHNRGIAVDLTVINLKTGKELNMGTGFDNFSDTAHHAFTKLPEEVLQNRLLLRSTMEKYGFKAFDTEWWHYYLANGERFGILDIGFKKMMKKL